MSKSDPPRHLSPDDVTAQLAQLEGLALLLVRLPDLTRLMAEIAYVERIGPAAAPADFKDVAEVLKHARELALAVETLRRQIRGHLWRLLRARVKRGTPGAIEKMAEFVGNDDEQHANGSGR